MIPNPSTEANGRCGVSAATITTPKVASASNLLGRLLKNGRRVRTSRTISAADAIDSMNQPVRNCSIVALSQINAPNVR